MLANALLALSARHAHLTRAVAVVDEYLADRYNDACLQVLKPTLASDTAVEDGDLLATLCLLRLLEEIDGTCDGFREGMVAYWNSINKRYRPSRPPHRCTSHNSSLARPIALRTRESLPSSLSLGVFQTRAIYWSQRASTSAMSSATPLFS